MCFQLASFVTLKPTSDGDKAGSLSVHGLQIITLAIGILIMTSHSHIIVFTSYGNKLLIGLINQYDKHVLSTHSSLE